MADRLSAIAGRPVELVFVDTAGDRQRDRPIAELGGRGIFTKEVQSAVLDGRADLAVHSAKDLPSSWTTEGLVLAAVPTRGDPRDALVGCAFSQLRSGAVIATGSARRQAQLAHLRPDLAFVGLRGNIGTRVARAEAPDVDAVVVACAGLAWIGLEPRIASVFSTDEMVPQVGQGALAIECRVDDRATREALARLEDRDSRRVVDAERSFLAHLGGGCDLPVGAHARLVGDEIEITGLVASLDGRVLLRQTKRGRDATIGAAVADTLMERDGGKDLLTARR